MPEPGLWRPHLLDTKGLVHRVLMEPRHTQPGYTVCLLIFTRHASYAEPYPSGVVPHMRGVDDVPTCVNCAIAA
jgi:hypothetical protein